MYQNIHHIFNFVCEPASAGAGERRGSAPTIRDVDGLSICADVDGLLDGKRIDRLSELASDKLSIRLSSFVSVVRYYILLFWFKAVREANEVVLKLKHLPKIFNFRSRFARALKLPERSASGERVIVCSIDCHGDCEYCVNH